MSAHDDGARAARDHGWTRPVPGAADVPGAAPPPPDPPGAFSVAPYPPSPPGSYPPAPYPPSPPGSSAPPAPYPVGSYPPGPYPPAPYPPSPYPPGPSPVWQPYTGAPPPRRRGNGLAVLATVVVWALVMAGIVVGVGALADLARPAPPVVADPSELVRLADPADLPLPLPSTRRLPTPGFEEAAAPLGRPAPPPERHDSYRFLDRQWDGEAPVPVTWSPCRPIHVTLNPADAPDGFEDDLLDALGVVSAATGLVFVYDGVTDERPDPGRGAYLPEAYGDRWAPVLVAWTGDEVVEEFEGDVVGVALSRTAEDRASGLEVRTTGFVYLDTDLHRYPRDPTGQAAYVSVLHHELGHLVGLGHVDDESQLMHPEDTGRLRTFADGDRTGLAQLGLGRCAGGL